MNMSNMSSVSAYGPSVLQADILPKNISDEFHYGHFRSESALRTGVLLFEIVLPMLLILGTVGNVLSIIVLSRPSMRKSVSTTFLLGLSVADLLVLYVCLMRDWIRYMKGDIRNASTWTCKVSFWLQYAFLDFSIWLLTSLTIERLVSTFQPFANRVICTKWHAKRIIIYILVVDLIVHCHFLFGMELRQEHRDGILVYACGPATEGYETFFKYAWHYIDLALFSLIPFFILLISNIYIIYKLVSKKRKLTAKSPTMMTSLAAQKTSSMTKLLVALNIIFIVTTAPIDIYLVCKPYIIPNDIPTGIEDMDPWYAFVKILMYINNSVNFILYIASGSKFRQELKKIFQELLHRYQSVALSSQTSPRSTQNTPSHSVIERATYTKK